MQHETLSPKNSVDQLSNLPTYPPQAKALTCHHRKVGRHIHHVARRCIRDANTSCQESTLHFYCCCQSSKSKVNNLRGEKPTSERVPIRGKHIPNVHVYQCFHGYTSTLSGIKKHSSLLCTEKGSHMGRSRAESVRVNSKRLLLSASILLYWDQEMYFPNKTVTSVT